MPTFDRRVRIRIRGTATVDPATGISQPAGIVVDEEVWAIKRDLGSAEDILADGSGTVITAYDTFTIRYRQDVASTPDTRISLIYEGRGYFIRRVRELGRRKYLEIEAGHVTGG